MGEFVLSAKFDKKIMILSVDCVLEYLSKIISAGRFDIGVHERDNYEIFLYDCEDDNIVQMQCGTSGSFVQVYKNKNSRNKYINYLNQKIEKNNPENRYLKALMDIINNLEKKQRYLIIHSCILQDKSIRSLAKEMEKTEYSLKKFLNEIKIIIFLSRPEFFNFDTPSIISNELSRRKKKERRKDK